MLDPSMVVNLRTVVDYKVENQLLKKAANLKYQRFTKTINTDAMIQIYAHSISSPRIQDYGVRGGGINFEDPVIGLTEWINTYKKWGFKIGEGEVNDLSRRGISVASEQAQKLGSAMAIYPEKLSVSVLQNGTSTSMLTDNGNFVKLVCYDGLPLFSGSGANTSLHPYNFKRPSLGGFCNLFSGAPGSVNTSNPGFLPLGGPFVKNSGTGEWQYSAGAEMSRQDGFHNLYQAITAIRQWKQSDGFTPRDMTPTGIIFGPALAEAVSTITDAKFISATSTNGGGSQEIEGMIAKLGLSEPIMLNWLSGQAGHEDYSWEIICEPDIDSSNFGFVTYGLLEPFELNMYSAVSGNTGVNYDLAVANEIRWISQCRSLHGVGLPEFGAKSQAPA